MRRFLEVIDPLEVERHQRTWLQMLGPELFTLLVSTRLLDPRGASDWWPCGNPGGGGSDCPRAIVPSGKVETPLVAVCGNGHLCDDVFLRVEDTELWVPSWTRFVALLRHVLRIDDAEPPKPIFARVFSLGITSRDGTPREALVALAPNDPGVAFFLSSRQTAPVASVVFVPTARRVPSVVAAQCARGAKIEIVALDEVLSTEGGRLAMRWPRLVSVPPPVLPAPPAAVPPGPARPFRAFTERGEVRLTNDEYDALVASAESALDLFVDAASTTAIAGKRKGRHRAGYRTPGASAWKASTLMPDQAQLLAEYVARRGVFLMPRELPMFAGRKPGEAEAILHRVQITRMLVDEAPWHWFKTDVGSQGRDLAYRFDPAPGRRFAVITHAPEGATNEKPREANQKSP